MFQLDGEADYEDIALCAKDIKATGGEERLAEFTHCQNKNR